ncbi:MAG: VTT domain-containing protein [Caldilineaceae bacterium]|nr:VTT domain-containing protein [Caldilineaceae bacterium]
MLIWLALIGGTVWFARVNGLSLAESVFALIQRMQASAYGPLLYILVYALRPLAFFSAILLTLAGGFLFGPLWGVVFTVIAANTSAMVAYCVGRFLGEGALVNHTTGGLLHNYAGRMRSNSFETVLIMRFIFLPYDLVNYLAGFLRIDWKGFLLATMLGSVPGTISFVLLGAAASPAEIEALFLGGELPTLDVRVLAISVAMFVVSLLLSRYFKRREQRAQPSAQ